MGMSVVGGGLKFVEAGSFRSMPSPSDVGDGSRRLGGVVVIAGASWRVVGGAPHPHRPGDRLVFVERLAGLPPGAGGANLS